jgi:hypothetical protein
MMTIRFENEVSADEGKRPTDDSLRSELMGLISTGGRRIYRALIVFIMILFGFASNARAAEAGRITGEVTDAVTHAGIEGLDVCAGERAEKIGDHCANTSPNGEYAISGIPTGSYVVEFLVPFGGPDSFQGDLDYAPQYYNGKATSTEAEEVAVTAGQATGGINAAMLPGGQITGAVTDAVTDDPIAGITVCASRSQVKEYPPIRCDVTNADGEYTIDPLVSGEYMVEFTAPSGSSPDYARQYYDDQLLSEQASMVPVTVGETTPGIDAAMQPGGNITGRVTVAATGNPLMNAEVCAYSATALLQWHTGPERCAQTNAHGEYTLIQLTAGQEIVEFYDEFGNGFVRQYYDGKSSAPEATQLSVTPGVTVTGVDASMHAIEEVKEEKIEPPHGTETETTLSTNLASAMPLIGVTPLVTLAASKVVVSGSVAWVRIACSRAACQGSIELTLQIPAKSGAGKTGKTSAARKTLALATGTFSLAGGHTRSVLLHLTPAGRRRLAHATGHPLAARLVLKMRGGATVSGAVVAG